MLGWLECMLNMIIIDMCVIENEFFYVFLKNIFIVMNICVICFIKKCGVMVDCRIKKILKMCVLVCILRCDFNICIFCCNILNCNEGIMYYFLFFVCVGM